MGEDRQPLKNLLIFNLKTDADDDVLGFTTDWINALAESFHQVFVIAMSAGRIAVAPNVRVFSVGKEKGYSEPRRALEFYRLLHRVLKNERVDACFAHMIPLFAVMGWPLLRRKRIPIVLWYGHKATPLMLRIAHRLVDRIVTSVPAGFQLPSEKVVVVGQGVSDHKFRYEERLFQSPFVITSVARLSKIKQIDLMVQATAILAARHGPDHIRLLLVGEAIQPVDWEYKKYLLEMVRRAGLEDVVQFVGSVPHHQVAMWMARSNVTINLAPTGAVDKAALESLAMGIPVLVRNRSFIPLFESADADSQLFVLAESSADYLADAIERWMTVDAHKRRALDSLSRTVFSMHGLGQCAARIAGQLYEVTKP